MGLKGIPDVISPELLHALHSMGHGDTIVLADANFPVSSVCKAGVAKEIRADGHSIPELLKAIMKLMPLDTYVYAPVIYMDLVNMDKNSGMPEPPIWEVYQKIMDEAEGKPVKTRQLERFEFYEEAQKSFAVVATGEKALYGNIILKKGVFA